jgi:predicted HTH transcriptional regulator
VGVITERLLDGREALPPTEMRQVKLLFGTPRISRALLKRLTLDCRARKSGQKRWDERVEVEHNVLQALRTAIEFFGRHVGMNDVSVDGLNATAGSADYVAMREALVNLFIHQDYADAAAAAQLEIGPDRAVFFNPGKSLVSERAMAEGGRSVTRNPLIARALRLIGFAELAGSGLREVQRVWRGARRRPPMFESNPAANTFTLTLDWRPVPEQLDQFWLEALGARVSPAEARILSLCGEPPGLSAAEIAAATDTPLDDAESAIERLKVNALLEEAKGRVVLPQRYRTLLAARGADTRRQ